MYAGQLANISGPVASFGPSDAGASLAPGEAEAPDAAALGAGLERVPVHAAIKVATPPRAAPLRIVRRETGAAGRLLIVLLTRRRGREQCPRPPPRRCARGAR